MARHRGARGGKGSVAPGGPALWIEEQRLYDNPYLGRSPIVHGVGDAEPGRWARDRHPRRQRGVLDRLAGLLHAAWSALRRQETPR